MKNTLKLNNWNFTLWIFDFDGNILKTDTPVYFQNKQTWEIEIFQAHFIDQNISKFYWENSLYKEVEYTYSEFKDVFSQKSEHRWFDWMFFDVQNAVKENNFAPSFEAFKDMYLVWARVFAILTARGNSADNFQRAFTYINENILSEQEKEKQFQNIKNNFNLSENISRQEALYHYFWNIINYIPCQNLQISKLLWFEKTMSSADRKAEMIEFLVKYFISLLENIYKKNISEILENWESISVWFSDDSDKNIIAVYRKMRNILDENKICPEINKKFSLYFTWQSELYPDLITKLGNKSNFRTTVKKDWLKIKLEKLTS